WRAERILDGRDPVGEFNRKSRKRAPGKPSADHRIVASCKDRADLDEKGAFARRDRRDPATPPNGVNVPLADRALEFDARAEGRARHHGHAPLGLAPMAMGGEPVAIGADACDRRVAALHAVQRAWRGFGDEARKIERTARLGPRTGESGAAERLHADRRADDVAVDIDIAGLDP